MSAAGTHASHHRGRIPAAGDRAGRILYQLVRGLLAIIGRTWWRLRMHDLVNLPAAGPYILAPVHRSIADTLVVCNVTRRRLRYMGKKELWSNGAAAWVLDSLGGFPVERGGADREALRRCIEVIEGGEPLVIFPEGTRQPGPELGTLFEGAAYVSARTGAPIVPIGLAGTAEVMPPGTAKVRRGHVEIVVGRPIPAPVGADGKRPPRSAIHDTTERLGAELAALAADAEQRRQARIAGRDR